MPGWKHTVNRSKGEEEPSRLPRFSLLCAAYLGAWLDSDGSLSKRRKEHPSPWCVTIGTTEVEHLSTFLQLTQAGSIGLYPPCRSRYNPDPKTQTPFWRWSIQRRAEVRDFVEQVRPYSLKAQAAIV